jgi:hypothetical protein
VPGCCLRSLHACCLGVCSGGFRRNFLLYIAGRVRFFFADAALRARSACHSWGAVQTKVRAGVPILRDCEVKCAQGGCLCLRSGSPPQQLPFPAFFFVWLPLQLPFQTPPFAFDATLLHAKQPPFVVFLEVLAWRCRVTMRPSEAAAPGLTKANSRRSQCFCETGVLGSSLQPGGAMHAMSPSIMLIPIATAILSSIKV